MGGQTVDQWSKREKRWKQNHTNHPSCKSSFRRMVFSTGKYFRQNKELQPKPYTVTQAYKCQTMRRHRRESWRCTAQQSFQTRQRQQDSGTKSDRIDSIKVRALDPQQTLFRGLNRPCSQQPERNHLATTLDRGLEKRSQFNGER